MTSSSLCFQSISEGIGIMKKDLSKVDLALAIVVVLCLSASVSANEIWVLPTLDPPKKGVGNWAVTEKGKTHFSFAVPDNMIAFQQAQIVVIGNKDINITYDLHLSLSQDGADHADFTDSIFGGVALFQGELLEIDVSAIFPPLLSGVDYVGLHLKTFKLVPDNDDDDVYSGGRAV